MWGNGYMMGWWWVVGAVVVVVAIAAVAWAVAASARGSTSSGPSTGTGAAESPRAILDARYARGELTTEQYQEALKNLGLGA